MFYFYMYLILFLVSACFDIWSRRFLMFPIATSAVISIILLLTGMQPLMVMVIGFTITITIYILRSVKQKRK